VSQSEDIDDTPSARVASLHARYAGTAPDGRAGVRRAATRGCASSLPEVRESSPLRAATITAERSTLASCIVSGLRAADPGTIRLLAGSLIYQTEEGATSTEIIGYGPAPAGGFMPVYMLTLTTAGPRVAIESRRNWKGNIDPIDPTAARARCCRTF
jgi:hypothetical protein